jgi:hypothetical protein
MLRPSKIVLEPLCLARWFAAATPTQGFPRIDIIGCDPRIVVVPRLWIERTSEPAGDVPANVYWTAYSAGLDSRRNLIPLAVVDGALQRPIRPISPDGLTAQGDNLELQAATPIILQIECAVQEAGVTTANGQSLWFAVDVYPADPSLDPGDFDALFHAIRCSQPAPLSLNVAT